MKESVNASECSECTASQTPLEEEADRLIRESSDEEERIYSERALMRKIRNENKRTQPIDETTLPSIAIDYLLQRHLELLISSANLTGFQKDVFLLHLQGWSFKEMESTFGVTWTKLARALRIARHKISCVDSPYEGLYEVYWQEVHRAIYRKP